VLAIGAEVARAYGRLASAVAQADRNPRPRAIDLLIAATAAADSARLITRNAADLTGLAGHLEIVALT
jgi:hypothetical protein